METYMKQLIDLWRTDRYTFAFFSVLAIVLLWLICDAINLKAEAAAAWAQAILSAAAIYGSVYASFAVMRHEHAQRKADEDALVRKHELAKVERLLQYTVRLAHLQKFITKSSDLDVGTKWHTYKETARIGYDMLAMEIELLVAGDYGIDEFSYVVRIKTWLRVLGYTVAKLQEREHFDEAEFNRVKAAHIKQEEQHSKLANDLNERVEMLRKQASARDNHC